MMLRHVIEGLLYILPLGYAFYVVQDALTARHQTTWSDDFTMDAMVTFLVHCSWISLAFTTVYSTFCLVLTSPFRSPKARSPGLVAAWTLPLLFCTSILYNAHFHLRNHEPELSSHQLDREKGIVSFSMYGKILLCTVLYQLEFFLSTLFYHRTRTTGQNSSIGGDLVLPTFLIWATVCFYSLNVFLDGSNVNDLFSIISRNWKGEMSLELNQVIVGCLIVLILFYPISILINIMVSNSMTRGERFMLTAAASIHLSFGIEFFLACQSNSMFFPQNRLYSAISAKYCWDHSMKWSHPSPILVFSWALIWGMIGIGIIASPLLYLSAKSYPRFPYKIWSFLFYLLSAFLVLVPLQSWAYYWLGTEPFLWTLGFVTDFPSRRLFITIYWICITGFGIGWIVTSVRDETNHVQLDGRRKYFHVMVCMMLAPVCFIDLKYEHLALSVVFAAMLLVEYVRLGSIWPFAPNLNTQLRLFLDERDTGPLFVSHFYLILGCAFPVWTSVLLPESTVHPCVVLAGMFSLGIGDTFASSIGKRYGSLKWLDTSKSVQGTFGFVSGLFCSYAAVLIIVGQEFNIFFVFILLGICVATGLLEAMSDQNDNIILPVYLMSLFLILLPADPNMALQFGPI